LKSKFIFRPRRKVKSTSNRSERAIVNSAGNKSTENEPIGTNKRRIDTQSPGNLSGLRIEPLLNPPHGTLDSNMLLVQLTHHIDIVVKVRRTHPVEFERTLVDSSHEEIGYGRRVDEQIDI
jgi:hypothetical protein